MRGADADEDRSCRGDAGATGEVEQQPGKRRPAPAHRRPCWMRADGVLVRALRRPDASRTRGAARPTRARSGRARAAATNTPGIPGRSLRSNAMRSMRSNPSSSPGSSSSRAARICEVGVCNPGSRRASLRSSSGLGSEPKRSSRRSTMFTCACASGVSIQTQLHRHAVAGGRSRSRRSAARA